RKYSSPPPTRAAAPSPTVTLATTAALFASFVRVTPRWSLQTLPWQYFFASSFLEMASTPKTVPTASETTPAPATTMPAICIPESALRWSASGAGAGAGGGTVLMSGTGGGPFDTALPLGGGAEACASRGTSVDTDSLPTVTFREKVS